MLALMGGVIGLLADVVGKKLGKKRLSIGGLRPKHTAQLGTFLLGFVISMVTQLAVLTFSSGVREWVLKGPQVAAKLQQANERLDTITKASDKAAKQNQALTSQNAKISNDLKSRQQDLSKAQASLAGLKKQISALQPQISKLSSLVRSGNKKITELKKSEQNLKAAKIQGEKNLKAVQAEQRQAKDKYNAILKDNKAVDSRNLELVQKQDDLIAKQKVLQGEQDRLNKELQQIQVDTKLVTEARDRTQQELTDSQQKLTDANKQLASVREELASTEEALKNSNIRVSGWKEISAIARRESMIYRIGEEVARLSVRPGLREVAARSELTSLVRRCRVEAQRRGAHSTPDFPVAGIFNHVDRDSQQTITTSAIEAQILSEITSAKTEMVLIASSSLNAFRGEPVSLEITVLPNPSIYSAGQIISETLIDGNRGDTVISEQFSKFLQQGVKDRAIKDGMIPISNSDISFGEVTLPDALRVIEMLKKADRKVRLQAISLTNVRAADPLRIDFKLR